jgi:hypothetical protein
MVLELGGMSQRLLALELEKAFLLDGKTPVADRFGSPAQLINVLLPNIFAIASLMVFIFIVGAGLKIVMNPDSKKGTEDGKKAITYGIGGFLLLFAAYWIVQLIQYVTGVTILG